MSETGDNPLPPIRDPKSEMLKQIGKEFYERMQTLLLANPERLQNTVVHADGSNTFDPHYERAFHNSSGELLRVTARDILSDNPTSAITLTHTLCSEKVTAPEQPKKMKYSPEFWDQLKGRRTYYDVYTIQSDGTMQVLKRRLNGSDDTYETQPMEIDPEDLLDKVRNRFKDDGPKEIDPDKIVRSDAESYAKWLPNHPQLSKHSLNEPPVKQAPQK